jgi:DNA-binding transcriptional ArsR family regulator
VSVKLMSAIFDSKTLAPTARLIMLALADHADDDGRCYPAMSRLCERTGLTDRAIQKNMKALVDDGFVTIHPNAGRAGSNLYIVTATPERRSPPNDVHPRTTFTTPPNDVRQTPERRSDKPSRTIIEPSEKKERASAHRSQARAILCEVASPAAVTSFMAYRNRHKGGALTDTAASRLAASLRAIFDAGGDPDDALGMAEERGWQTVKPDWYFKERTDKNGNRRTGITERHAHRTDPALEQIARLAGIGRA